ncbi:MAG: signal peptidase II [Ilumatobacteraceae bacterium]|jgi:signal peptidase II|nr:signal peptidase II [Acidimicrobiia bacterium]NCZ87760.1 signal peptidase II [Actinomycetota bacterium]NDD17377.1 signal peptidase II [Acidimicrobiia bacterium]NDD60927.1 signal peptidase II [Actinomycetota bacterium]NDH36390.1 signal peptidase II [Acidimicrobiia bacterium]
MTRSATRRLWLLIAFIVAADQATKHWALNRLSNARTIDLIGSLRFNLAFNKGMAFSQATGAGPIIGALAFVVIIVIVLWLRRNAQGLAGVAAGLIVGGATGNLIDRLLRGDAWLRGAVVDFIDLQWWPIFNIADAAISTGAVLMIVASVRASKSTS